MNTESRAGPPPEMLVIELEDVATRSRLTSMLGLLSSGTQMWHFVALVGDRVVHESATFAAPYTWGGLPLGKTMEPQEAWAPGMRQALEDLRTRIRKDGWTESGHGEQPWADIYTRPGRQPARGVDAPAPVAARMPARRRLRHPRTTAVVTAILGGLAAALGGGVAVRHLIKAGLTWISASGLLALIVGLALLGFAGVIAWRSTRRWRRLWLLPVGLVALLVMSSIAQGAMLAWAPRNSLGEISPADRGLSYTDVWFSTADGVRLSAWYIPSTNHSAIVAVPGSGSTRAATLSQSAVLVRHGYGVLMVDPRGQGRSGGHAMDAGWYGDLDVSAAVTFLQRQPGVDPHRIGVLGLSMGGEEAIGAAAVNPAVRAVVSEGATHRTAADKAGYLPGGIAGAVQRGLDQLTYGTAALLSPAPSPATLHGAIASATTTPFLLIVAGEGLDEPEAAHYLRTAAPDRVQVWTVTGASHVQGLATSPSEWESRVTAFFDHALGAPTARLVPCSASRWCAAGHH